MESSVFQNETPQEILLKIKKVKALAEGGIGGEKEAAQRLLETLCAKYGVTPEELNEEQKKEYMFRVRNSVLKLFLQVYTFMFDATERYENDLHYYKKKGVNDHFIGCDFTPSEYIEFSQLWEWHRQNYLVERKRMRELFEKAYIKKHSLYPNEIRDEYRASKKKKDTLQDLNAIMALTNICSDKTFHKQIENTKEN
jgi:hypothetical protein